MTTTRPTTGLVTDIGPRRRTPRHGHLDRPCREIKAAARAGVGEVPCIVRELTDAERIEIMLVENLQHATLDVSAEASGYFRLVGEHAYTIRRLAKQVGKSERHVRSRLALLELPSTAQEALARDELTIGQAEALLAAKERPDVIDAVLGEPEWRRRDMAQAVADGLRRAEHEDRKVALVAELEAAGIRVVESEGHRPQSYVRLDELGFEETEHHREPCHAVVVEMGYAGPAAHPVCTDRRRHSRRAPSTERSELQAEARPPDPEREQAKERRRLANRRAEFINTRLSGRLPKVQSVDLLVATLLHRANSNDASRAGGFLGIEPRPGRYGSDWHSPLADLAAESEANRLRVGVALAAAMAEARMAAGGHRDARSYVEFLAGLGYEPVPGEDLPVQPTQEPDAPNDDDDVTSDSRPEALDATASSGCT